MGLCLYHRWLIEVEELISTLACWLLLCLPIIVVVKVEGTLVIGSSCNLIASGWVAGNSGEVTCVYHLKES